MDFNLLGPMEARVGGNLVDLGPRKRRLVLALLLLELGRLVSVERLIDLLWNENPPPAARRVVFAHVSRLRRVLSSTRDDDAAAATITTNGSGYSLQCHPDRVDVHRFQRLVSQAAGIADLAARADLLREGLSLWRGPALMDVADDPVRERLCRGLDDLRLVALEDRFDADLDLGRHRDVIADLATAVGEHPYRERLVGQLMLARYRSAQQGQALAVFQQTRSKLADDLGIDPGPELTRLHQAILRNEAELAAPARQPVLAPAEGQIRPAPAQLPGDVGGFTGRAAQLKQLSELWPGDSDQRGTRIVAIVGGAGVGKTALAVHWAHEIRSHFPDGQLHLDLRGYSTIRPLRPLDALARMLPALGTPAGEIPFDVDQASALYRSRLDGSRTLILLDNAASPDQVRPLLPGGSECLVIVTSRSRLTGLTALDGARPVELDVLDATEAASLLATILGVERVGNEPEEAAQLATRCAHLPLALRIAAANLADQPRLTISGYLDLLTDADLLGALAIDGDDRAAVRLAIDLSYARLPPAAQRIFRLFGFVPGPDLTPDAASALAELPAREARQLLALLAGVHLLDQHQPGRFTAHDLLRHYCRQRADADDNAADRLAATQRLINLYIDHARAAADVLYPDLLRLPNHVRNERLTPFTDHAAALAWLDSERSNLIAAVRVTAADGPRSLAWRLTDCLRGYLSARRNTVDWIVTTQAALGAAEHEGDLNAQAAGMLSLASAFRSTGRFAEAIDLAGRASSLGRRTGWTHAEVAASVSLANLFFELGQYSGATQHYQDALLLCRDHHLPGVEAIALGNLANLDAYSGRLADAEIHYSEALVLARDTGSALEQAHARLGLAGTYLWQGRLDEAVALGTEVLARFRHLGEQDAELQTLATLGEIHSEAGRYTMAVDHLRAASRAALECGNIPRDAEIRASLGVALQRAGNHHAAIVDLTTALRLARDVGSRHGEAMANVALAVGLLHLGDAKQARGHARDGLHLAREGGFQVVAAKAMTVIAGIHLAGGDLEQAAATAQEALGLHRTCGHRPGEAVTLHLLGTIAGRAGDTRAAHELLREAAVALAAVGFVSAAGDSRKDHPSSIPRLI